MRASTIRSLGGRYPRVSSNETVTNIKPGEDGQLVDKGVSGMGITKGNANYRSESGLEFETKILSINQKPDVIGQCNDY